MIIDSINIDKEKAKVLYKVTGKKLQITWSNGTKEEFKIDKVRSLDYEAEPKPSHLMFLVTLLEKAHGQNEEIWNLLIDDICKQEDGNRELNPFFPLDVLSLLELCREENMVCTQKFWSAICKRRIDGNIKSEILDVDSLSRLKTPGLIHEIFTESATTTDEIQTEFIDVWKKQTSKTFTNSIACLMSQSNKHIDLYWKILIEVAMTTQREHLGDENWLTFLNHSLKFFVSAMKNKSSEFLTFMEILIEELPVDNKKVESIFGEIIQQAQSDRISQKTLLRLMEKMLEKNHVLLSINAVSLCIQKICGEEQIKSKILLCLVKLLYQLITKPHSWDIIRYERKVDLKKLCACLFNITGEEETEFAAEEDYEQMTKIKTKCLVNILCSNEPLKSIDILSENNKEFKEFINLVARVTMERDLIKLFANLIQNRKTTQLLKITLEETFKYVFYTNDAPMIEGYVHFFEIFSQSLVHSSNEVVLKYVLEHTFDFLHGLISNNIKVKESCWFAILCVYELDNKRKSELLEMSGCKITPPQSTIQELLALQKKPDIDILKEYQSLITGRNTGRSLHQVKENMISDEIKKVEEYIDCIQKGKSPNTVTPYPYCLNLIWTQTTTKTLSRVLEVIDNPVNLLLEGSTGIGKTAIVTEAARILGKRLLRFNLSSSTSISNLFGSAFPSEKNDKIEINFHKGDFTTAYSEGYWLLLDEFNLAPDNVLSCIKDALDNGILVIPTDSAETGKSGEDQKYIQYEKHENFRLFCTQNPSSGFYKGKREEHSGSMLSRFCPIVVPKPNIEEFKNYCPWNVLKSWYKRS